MFRSKPQFAIFCMRSSRISRNGMSVCLNTTYTNINGIENMFLTINQPRNINLKKEINYLNDEISNFKTKKNECFQKLKNEQQKNLQKCDSEFYDFKKMFENIKITENDKKIKEKEEELRKIKKKNKNINLNETNLNDTFMYNEQKRINKNYLQKKKDIDTKYSFKEPKLKTSKINNEKKKNYIKNIRRLNTYANNPNFNTVVNNFKLNSILK